MGYDNTNTFSLNKETDKKKEKSPDYWGKYEVKCPHCQQSWGGRLAGWIRDGKYGKFISGAIEMDDDQKAQKTPAPAPAPAPQESFDDDIPF